jgi:hypothetical protein
VPFLARLPPGEISTKAKFILGVTVVFALLFSAAVVTVAQSANVQSGILQAVDEKNMVTLKGNTHPLAAAENDRGEAPGGLAKNRMLLVLQHKPAQEAAIKQLLAEQQNQSSSSFHKWLTKEQYGQMFGPSDQDIKTITHWLQSRGFEVANVSPGRHVIEFSGDGVAGAGSVSHLDPSRFGERRRRLGEFQRPTDSGGACSGGGGREIATQFRRQAHVALHRAVPA